MSRSSDLLRADFVRKLAAKKAGIEALIEVAVAAGEPLIAELAELALFEIGLWEEDQTIPPGNPNN